MKMPKFVLRAEFAVTAPEIVRAQEIGTELIRKSHQVSATYSDGTKIEPINWVVLPENIAQAQQPRR